jgi:Protein of unknown function DUF262
MNPNLPKPSAITLSIEDLVRIVRAGKVRIPNFQRAFKWQRKDVKSLLDSIVKGFPIGSFLFWEKRAPHELITIGKIIIDAPQTDAAYWVVDGQQRLTSLANVVANDPDSRFQFSYNFEVKRFVETTRHNQDVEIPVPDIFDLQRLFRWITARPEMSQYLDDASAIAKSIREYMIPAYVVQTTDESVLRDIFDRMNNYGKRLTRAEVFTALHETKSELPQSFSRIAEEIEAELGFGRIDDDTVMMAVLARRSASLNRDIRQEFSPSEVDFYQNGKRALGLAIQFLQREADVPHFGFLAYRYQLIVLCRFFGHFPDPLPRTLTLLKRWYWRTTVLGTEPLQGGTQAPYKFAVLIEAGKESESIKSMLELVRETQKGFGFSADRVRELDDFRATSASSRIVLCALWANRPRRLSEELDAYTQDDLTAALGVQSTASSIVFPVIKGEAKNPGNVAILIGDDRQRDLYENHISNLQQSQNKDWLASHFLEQGDSALSTQDFLTTRKNRIVQACKDFCIKRMEPSFEDTPALATLIGDNFDAVDDEDFMSDVESNDEYEPLTDRPTQTIVLSDKHPIT